jgi:23S rRNA (cytidine1920-2'-O)/16S rRNA (cytidine1409-2'-O)-methyltransferase
MESTNARYVEQLPEPINIVTIDASFISLKILLPVVRRWGKGQAVVLIKPQFEVGRKEAARGKGVVRDPTVHKQVLLDILRFAQDNCYQILGLGRSPVLGPKGNVEFLGWLGFNSVVNPFGISIEKLISNVIDKDKQ